MGSRRKLKNEQLKMGQILELMLLFLAFIFLSSCSRSDSLLPVPQEMGNMTLIRTFAVDLGEEQQWKVTISSGKQSSGLQGQQEAPVILSGESASLQGACRQLEGLTDHTIFYGYVDQLVMSTAMAEEGIENVLEYFASSGPLSLGTGIWLSEDSAQSLLTNTQEEGAESYLTTLTKDSRLGLTGITRKVGEVFTDIREKNCSYIPVLQGSTQGGLEEIGYGLLSEDAYLTLLQGRQAQGLTLLLEHDQLLEVEKIQGVYALNLSQIELAYHGDWSGQKLNSVSIHLNMKGDLLEFPTLPDEESQKRLVEKAEEEVVELCKSTLTILQELGVDILGIGGELALYRPSEGSFLRQQWGELFSEVPIEVTAKISLGQINGY